MSLAKRQGSIYWWAVFTVPGHPRVRESTGEVDRVAAQKRHDEIKAALWSQPVALRGKTWGKAVAAWCTVQDRSNSELLSLAKFGRRYKDRRLVDMTPESVDAALSFCQTASTYMRYNDMIAAILTLAGVKLKLLKRKVKQKPREWLAQEQWLALLAELPAHMKPMAEFAIATGLRQANVLGLTWKRVDIERKLVWVEAEDAKAEVALAVPLSKDAVAVLKKQVGQNEEFVFTFRGKPIADIKTAFISACVRAKVGHIKEDGFYDGFTWHGFRHTWATWHVQSGTPLEVLQKLGGWKDLRMVLRYAHHSPGHLASYADNVAVSNTVSMCGV